VVRDIRRCNRHNRWFRYVGWCDNRWFWDIGGWLDNWGFWDIGRVGMHWWLRVRFWDIGGLWMNWWLRVVRGFWNMGWFHMWRFGR